MLEQAKAKANEQNLPVKFIESDIRLLDLPEVYDVIFIPFNSIHHLYTNRDFLDVLLCVKKHLKDEGYFLFDCFNPDIHYIVHAEKKENTIAEYATDDGRDVLIKQTMRYENTSQINRIQWHYYINGEFHSIENMDMRMFFPQELESYLESAGFNIIHKYGGFQEETFENNSPKQVFVCKKSINNC